MSTFQNFFRTFSELFQNFSEVMFAVKWYCDIFFNKVTSVNGHTCAAIIYNGPYIYAKPFVSKADVYTAA